MDEKITSVKTKTNIAKMAVITAVSILAIIGFVLFILDVAKFYGIGTLPPGENAGGLIGWWGFNENQGNLTKNFVGGKDGMLWYWNQTNPYWEAGQGPWEQNKKVVGASAVRFDYTSSYVALDTSFADVKNNKLSIVYWLYLEKPVDQMGPTPGSARWPTTIDKYTVKGDGFTRATTSYTHYFSTSTKKLIVKWVDTTGAVHDSSNANKANVSQNPFQTNQWYLVAWVFDGSKASLYVVDQSGAKSVNTTSVAGLQLLPLPTGQLNVSSKSQTLDGGIIDELRIYNRALKSEEITAIWNKSIPVPLVDLLYVGSRCIANASGTIDYANCYMAIDNICTIQSKLTKNQCIETFIAQAINIDNGSTGAYEYDPEGQDVTVATAWPLLSDDLIVKYCLYDLNYERANRPYCKNSLQLIDPSVFRTPSNISLINDALRKLGLVTTTATRTSLATAIPAKTSGSGCGYSSCSDCKPVGSSLVAAAANCPSGGSSCQAPKVTNSCSGSQRVICRSPIGRGEEEMDLEDCLAEDWYSYCPITGQCNKYNSCDCNWLSPSVNPNAAVYCKITYNRGFTEGSHPIPGSDELSCKVSHVLTHVGYNNFNIGTLHSGGGNAVDLIYTKSGTPLERINQGRTLMYLIGPDITTNYRYTMRALSELTPCEIKGLGSKNSATRRPMVHLDVQTKKGTPSPGCAYYGIKDKNNPIYWTGSACVTGAQGYFPQMQVNQATLDAELIECPAGNVY